MKPTISGIAMSFIAALGAGLVTGCDSPEEEEVVVGAEGAAVPGPVADGRPDTVPDAFVATPGGWSHPTCVIEVGPGDRIGRDGAVVRADGETWTPPPCRHPRYDVRGEVVARVRAVGGGGPEASPGQAASGPLPTVNGWVAAGEDRSQGPLAYINATWTVPPAPTVQSGQTIFYFPGLEPLATGYVILQPVLQWQQGSWAIASWHVTQDQIVYRSNLVTVQSGDTINGYVYGTGCAGGVCSSWTIVTQDLTTGQWVVLYTHAYGQALDWAFGGALEAYGVDDCRQYPPSPVTFSNIWVYRYDNGWYQVQPTWTAMATAPWPACGAAFSSSGPTAVTVSTTVPQQLPACVANAACTVDLSACAEYQKASAWQGQTSLAGTLQLAYYTSRLDWVCQTAIPQAWPVRTEPGWWCGRVVQQCSCSPGDNCH